MTCNQIHGISVCKCVVDVRHCFSSANTNPAPNLSAFVSLSKETALKSSSSIHIRTPYLSPPSWILQPGQAFAYFIGGKGDRQWIWTICWVGLVVEEQGSSLWSNGFTKCLSAPAGGPLLRLRLRYWYNVISSRPFSSFIASAPSLSRIRLADPSDLRFAFLFIAPASLPQCSLSDAMR